MGAEDGVMDPFGPQNSHQATHSQLPPAWHGYNHCASTWEQMPHTSADLF